MSTVVATPVGLRPKSPLEPSGLGLSARSQHWTLNHAL
jgi:hypothetical protein